jgi:predicted 2-oxoglutarate/Fe(II)-dependent dioxygenase YbiX
MLNRLKQSWRVLLFLIAAIPGACVAPAFPQAKNGYEFNDAHFHLTNNVQEFGIPLQQEWSYRVDGDRAPTY